MSHLSNCRHRFKHLNVVLCDRYAWCLTFSEIQRLLALSCLFQTAHTLQPSPEGVHRTLTSFATRFVSPRCGRMKFMDLYTLKSLSQSLPKFLMSFWHFSPSMDILRHTRNTSIFRHAHPSTHTYTERVTSIPLQRYLCG